MNKPQTGGRRRRGVGSERNIEEGEKTDTSEIHINVQSRGNDGLTGDGVLVSLVLQIVMETKY